MLIKVASSRVLGIVFAASAIFPQDVFLRDINAGETVVISQRQRGSPLDLLVAELMILANSTWAQMLDQVGLPGLFRVQPAGKVRMSTQSEPHIGMGVQHYGWFTSPLRRAAATAVIVDGTRSLHRPPPPATFHADHPFVDHLVFAVFELREDA